MQVRKEKLSEFLSNYSTVHAKANPNNSNRQFVAEVAVTPVEIASACASIDYVTVTISYNKNANDAYFDNILLIAEPAATYYYDDDGNITTVQSPDGNKPIYEYAPNKIDLTSLTNPDGSSYTIEYVENNGESNTAKLLKLRLQCRQLRFTTEGAVIEDD